jgi:hypothetical protein
VSLSPDYPQGDDFVSNVIDFLQRLAQDADLRHAPRTALELALAEADIDPALREALLGAIMASPGKKEEDEEEDEDDLEDDEDEDDEDEDDDEDDFDDDEDDEDEDDDDDDEDEEEENSLTPRRSTVRRVA